MTHGGVPSFLVRTVRPHTLGLNGCMLPGVTHNIMITMDSKLSIEELGKLGLTVYIEQVGDRGYVQGYGAMSDTVLTTTMRIVLLFTGAKFQQVSHVNNLHNYGMQYLLMLNPSFFLIPTLHLNLLMLILNDYFTS